MTGLQIKIAPKQIHPVVKDDDANKESQDANLGTYAREPYATVEELNSGKLPPEEILSLPKFKVSKLL